MAVRDVKLAIVGCVRNAAKDLLQTLVNVERIADLFPACQFVFAESDSDDDSLEMLQSFARRHPDNCRIVPLGCLRHRFPLRTQRLAHVRNVLLAACRKMFAEGAATHMLVMDMDDKGARQFSPEAILSCFCHGGWAVMASSDPREHYDIWALRWPGKIDHDCWCNGYGEEECRKVDALKRACALPRDAPLVPVNSAFNGAAFYDLSYVKPAHSYIGTVHAHGTDIEICEHVPFHEQIRADGGRIFINPQFAPD